MDNSTDSLQVLLEELNTARDAFQTAQAKYEAAKNSTSTQQQYGGFWSADDVPAQVKYDAAKNSCSQTQQQFHNACVAVDQVSTVPTFNANEIGRDMKKLWTGVTDKKMWTGVSDVFTLNGPNT